MYQPYAYKEHNMNNINNTPTQNTNPVAAIATIAVIIGMFIAASGDIASSTDTATPASYTSHVEIEAYPYGSNVVEQNIVKGYLKGIHEHTPMSDTLVYQAKYIMANGHAAPATYGNVPSQKTNLEIIMETSLYDLVNRR